MKAKKSIFVLIFFVASISFFSYAQSTFEGKVVIETTNDGETNTLNYYSKGNMARFDVNSARGEANVIFDKKNKKMLMVMPAMKMYMEFPMDMKFGGDYKAKGNDNSSVKKMNMDFVKTGEMKNVNGYNCVKWIIKEDDGTSEAWMTKDLGSFIFFQSPMGGKEKTKWQEDIEASGYFPMLVIQKDSDGNETGKFEVKSVEKKSLDDSFFSVPAGYNKMKMPMGGGK